MKNLILFLILMPSLSCFGQDTTAIKKFAFVEINTMLNRHDLVRQKADTVLKCLSLLSETNRRFLVYRAAVYAVMQDNRYFGPEEINRASILQEKDNEEYIRIYGKDEVWLSIPQ